MMGFFQFGINSLAALMDIPMQPPVASSIAEGVDQLYLLLTGITLFFSVLIFSIIFYFMIKYRRRSEARFLRKLTRRCSSSWPGPLFRR